MKALKAYNTDTLNRFHKRKVHNTDAVELPQDDPPESSVPDHGLSDLPESDLDFPEDPILVFLNSPCHSSDGLDQSLQVYWAYKVLCSQIFFNHPYIYYVARASQVKHGCLVDRDANGGHAGSDARILSRTSRKCTVTGTDSHELQGLDVVQCAALVETNHGTLQPRPTLN